MNLITLGLKRVYNTGVKFAKRALPKHTPNTNKTNVKEKLDIDFLNQTSIYDPNSFDYIHRLF